MKRQWTRGEKLLWLAPLLFIIGAGAALWGPQIARRQLGLPQLLQLNAGDRADALVLSRDGSTLAATLIQPAPRDMPGEVYFWDARTLEPMPALGTRPPKGKMNASNFALTLSPDGKSLAMAPLVRGKNQPYTLFNRATQRARWSINGFFWNAEARFAPDGKTLLVSRGAKDGCQALLLRASDGKVLSQFHSRVFSDSMLFCWAPAGKTFACSGAYSVPETKENFRGIAYQVEIRRASDGHLLRQWNSSPLQSLNFSADGSRLVAVTYERLFNGGTTNYLVVAFNATTGHKQWEFGGQDNGQRFISSFSDAKFSPDGKLVAALSHGAGQIALLDSQTGKLKRTLKLDSSANSHSSSPDALAWAPDSKRLYARGQNAVLVWDLD